jgi:hypothetical protein
MNSGNNAVEPDKRCRYPGCNNVLREDSEGKYCDTHKELFKEDGKESGIDQDPKKDAKKILNEPEFLTL